MKLIFAQGNPDAEYAKTRHNVGFMAIDYFATHHQAEFHERSKFNSLIAELRLDDEKVLLAKPLTYYNETGRAALMLSEYYRINTSDILVIHDELNLPFGTLRTRDRGSDAGNNGIKSLNAHLGEDYSRIRVGTYNDLAANMSDYDFVLGKFSKEELEKLDNDIYPKISELIEDFISGNHEITSHKM